VVVTEIEPHEVPLEALAVAELDGQRGRRCRPGHGRPRRLWEDRSPKGHGEDGVIAEPPPQGVEERLTGLVPPEDVEGMIDQVRQAG
jgi:hypothetical protein